ncbi:hypothetical protein EDB83DRAFT_1566679 [Lactarius deliciosus]|nr:hypothetical protein EDB83DRAFT_1566679 [Lactarius deliciosus]
MITSDSVQQQVTEVLPLNGTPARVVEARALPPVGRGKHSSTRAASSYRNLLYAYPRIPRPAIRQGIIPMVALDSQFQVNASHVQKPLSLVSNGNRERGILVSPARCDPVPEDGKQSDTRSSSSYEQFKSNGSDLTKQESPYVRSRRRSPPTDSEDEDPFHFDNILSSPPSKRDDSPRRTLSSSLFRRASIVPVDPSAAPAPHRFSLLREHASDGTIFVQEICDAEGRRWSLRVPASGLPNDMVSMLEELENLALELGQTLPRIVVTCSAESLSSKRAAPALRSAELLHPPPTSLAKEKCRLVEPEPEPVCEEEPARFPATSTPAVVSSPSEQSLACIYLPEVSARPASLSPLRSSRSPSWRPSSCPAARLPPFCSPQTASTANRPRPPPQTLTTHDSAPSSPRSETESPRGPRAAALPGESQQPQQPASRPRLKTRPPPRPRRRDPASR